MATTTLISPLWEFTFLFDIFFTVLLTFRIEVVKSIGIHNHCITWGGGGGLFHPTTLPLMSLR